MCDIYHETDDDGVEVGFFLWIWCGQVSSIKDEDSRWLLILEVSWSSEAEGLRNSEPLGLLASVWRLMPFDECQTTHTRTFQIPFFSHEFTRYASIYTAFRQPFLI